MGKIASSAGSPSKALYGSAMPSLMMIDFPVRRLARYGEI